jgi:anti-sigma regulatory factor (Ser/Thr protein kinase)
MEGKVARMRLTADLTDLAAIRRFVAAELESLRVDSSVTHDVLLALNELITNAIIHGYGRAPGPIEVEIACEGTALICRVRDAAPPFDPTQAPDPDITLPLHQRRPGGLGVFLARQLTDHMTHRALPDGGNETTLIKYDVVRHGRGGMA